MSAHNCLPSKKYPHIDPLFGLDFLSSVWRNFKHGTLLRSNQDRHERHGRTFETNVLGQAPMIHTIEPANLKTLMATKFDDYGFAPLRQNWARDLWGPGILSSDGAFWQHSRALLRPTFARTQIADFGLYQRHVDRMIEAILAKGRETVDLHVYFKRYILDTSSEFLFGESVDSQLQDRNTEEKERFIAAFDYVSTVFGRSRHLWTWLQGGDRKWDDSVKTVHAFVDKQVDRAIRRAEEKVRQPMGDSDKERRRYILVEEMAELSKDRIDLRHQLLHVFIPAHESPGVLLAAVFYALARDQRVWEKLREEVLRMSPEDPEYETLKDMKYLRYVQDEAIRVYTPFFAGQKQCLQDSVLPLGGGPTGDSPILVRKGQVVAYDLWALHKDKSYWGADAEEFRPERWEAVRPMWEFIPFNGGPRTCLAQQMVYLETAYVIIRMVQTFRRLQNRDDKPWKECLKLSVRNESGVQVGLFAD